MPINSNTYTRILPCVISIGGLMQINRINNRANFNPKGLKYIKEENPKYSDRSNVLVEELNKMSAINNVNLAKKDFELNLSHDELEKRTHKDYLTTKKMLAADALEYESLADGDKAALKHLVKAAAIIDRVEMQIDNHYNLAFKEYLENEISKGKGDWQKQKKEAARLRKIENDRVAIESEIEALEKDNEEIGELFLSEEVATNSAKLNELNTRLENNNSRLKELYEKWEGLVS